MKILKDPACVFLLLAAGLYLAAYSSVLLDFDHGQHDDYNALAQVESENSGLIPLATSMGRPIYGLLLEGGFRMAKDVAGLTLLRWCSLGFLICLVGLLAGQLEKMGYDREFSRLVALSAGFLPASQVIISWATVGPYFLAAAIALLSFRIAAPGAKASALRGFGAAAIFAVSILIFQPSSLMYLLGFSAFLLLRQDWTPSSFIRYCGYHVAIVAGGAILAFVIVQFIIFATAIEPSDRTVFTNDLAAKARWFWEWGFRRSLNIFFLEYNFAGDGILSVRMTAVFRWLVAAILFAGLLIELMERNAFNRMVVLLCIPLLVPAHYIFNLVVLESYFSYRSTLPLSAFILFLFVFALWKIFNRLGLQSRARLTATIVLVAVGMSLASYHTYQYISYPQKLERSLARLWTRDIDPYSSDKVYIIESGWGSQSARIWDGEFGSPTFGFDWGSRFLVYSVLKERFPDLSFRQCLYQLYRGPEPPESPEEFAHIIDARKLALTRH